MPSYVAPCQAVLALLDGRLGVLDTLNEECVRPRGSEASLVAKLDARHGGGRHAHFEKRKTTADHFSVRHYAGLVEYTATGGGDAAAALGGTRRTRRAATADEPGSSDTPAAGGGGGGGGAGGMLAKV